MTTYTLKIIEIKQETADTITVCFKQPALRKIKYVAGQYLTLIFRINGRRYLRPYSFSSSPSTEQTLDVTVKRIPGGIVSNHIHDMLAIGDSVEVMPPMGDFIYDREIGQKEVYLWGVGSGITPLISIAKQVLNDYKDKKVALIYGNRNHETTIFSSSLESLLSIHQDRFRVWHFHTKNILKDSPPYLIDGRITVDKIINILADEDLRGTVHYICGPLGLKQSVKEVLDKIGVPKSAIFTEDFEIVKNPADFNDILTQTVSIQFENENFDVEVVKGKSILESALESGIELPYSCQTGNCSICKGKLKQGNIKMIGLAHTRNDLLEDEYLLCCSYPLSNSVNIEI